MSEYRDRKQVELDVQRLSLNKASSSKLNKRIRKILQANPDLHYYQGFHDIAQHTKSTKQLEQLAFNHLRDFLATDFQPTLQILQLVPELLVLADPDAVGKQIQGQDSDMISKGLFAVSPIITLFSHTCDDPQLITHIIQKVLKHGISYSIYLFVALCVQPDCRTLILEASDPDEIYMALINVGSKLDMENISIVEMHANKIKSQHPLSSLESFSQISQYSVLKTGSLTNTNTVMFTVRQIGKPQSRGSKFSGGKIAVFGAVGIVLFSIFYSRVKSRS